MWVKVDEHFPEHQKVMHAGAQLGAQGPGRVIAVWLPCSCYANRVLTNGFVPEQVIKGWTMYDRRPLDVAYAMSLPLPDGSAGLMERAAGGFRLHDYLEYQPAAADVKAQRERDALRKRLYAVPGLVDAIRDRDQDRCRYCGVKVNWRDRRGKGGGTYDFLDPRAPVALDNVVVCCAGCALKGGRAATASDVSLLEPGTTKPGQTQFGTNSGPSSKLDLDQRCTRPDPTRSRYEEHENQSGVRRTHAHDEDPNIPVLTRLVHSIVEEDPAKAWDIFDLSEEVKTRAARAHLAYDGESVRKAMDSAAFQRRDTDPNARDWSSCAPARKAAV